MSAEESSPPFGSSTEALTARLAEFTGAKCAALAIGIAINERSHIKAVLPYVNSRGVTVQGRNGQQIWSYRCDLCDVSGLIRTNIKDEVISNKANADSLNDNCRAVPGNNLSD